MLFIVCKVLRVGRWSVVVVCRLLFVVVCCLWLAVVRCCPLFVVVYDL